MIEFSEERHPGGAGVIPLRDAEIRYEFSYRWENILTTSARCGAKESYTITREVGVSREDREQVSSALKGTLGSAAIASIQSELARQTGTTTNWRVQETVGKHFEFTAPACGEYVAIRYQLLREIDLRYSDYRWFRNRGWSTRIIERLPRFHDGSHIFDPIPECNCKTKYEIGQPDEFMLYRGC